MISWYPIHIGKSSSAQHLTQAEPRSQHGSCQEQPSNLYLATPDDADVVDERLLDSPSNESETSREHQTSDSERESPQSSMSELTESTLIQPQPSTMSSTLEHTVSKSTSPIQPYPEHDVGPRSQYAHPPIRHHSKLTRNERRQNEAQAGFSHDDFSYDTCKVCVITTIMFNSNPKFSHQLSSIANILTTSAYKTGNTI